MNIDTSYDGGCSDMRLQGQDNLHCTCKMYMVGLCVICQTVFCVKVLMV